LQLVKIVSFLFHDGDVLPDLFTVIGVDVIEGDVGIFIERD
jgi:hypothetical protein